MMVIIPKGDLIGQPYSQGKRDGASRLTGIEAE
jgi:hypothetical protein